MVILLAIFSCFLLKALALLIFLFTFSSKFDIIITEGSNFEGGENKMGLKLGQYIRSIRKEKKMSVRVLSEQADISKSYIDYIESGAREPSPDMLAKIAVVLDIPLKALLDIQKKEQLEVAINKLRIERANTNKPADLRAVARTADGKLCIDDEALLKTQEAFRDADNTKLIADFIENPDLRAIVKAGAELSDEELNKLRKVMESLYPDAFNKQNP